jgi:hypothetical protein
MTPERPQRGILLYHEMGAGKSRTVIEMVQRYLEHKFWASIAADKSQKSTQPSWWGDRPNVFLFSPTQEARSHFLLNEVPLWMACWWSQHSTTPDRSQWVPLQRVYTSFVQADLEAEIQHHESLVQQLMWNEDPRAHPGVMMSIVLNNTNNMFRVLEHVRKGLLKKTLTPLAKKEILSFFGVHRESSLFDITSHTNIDEYYGRFFKDAFVIVDEMHALCNSIATATLDKGMGPFYYRALMEAPNCTVVGLSGTPMQKTALSFAPMFNILCGKIVVWTLGFSSNVRKELQDEIFSQIRPFAETVWFDHTQMLENGQDKHAFTSKIEFTPWNRLAVYTELNQWVGQARRKYNKSFTVHIQEYELFPYAFQQLKSGKRKHYTFDNEAFLTTFDKTNENHIRNPVQFATRIAGLVSYVSPPKVTTLDNPNLDATQQYPTAEVKTCYLTLNESQMEYLKYITKLKREINQKQADVEERSGCNVNWGCVHNAKVLQGHRGLLKLFLKTGKHQSEGMHDASLLEEQYHKLLTHVHVLFARRDPIVLPYMQMKRELGMFSPKLYQIVTESKLQRFQKGVVYSGFVDGIGNTEQEDTEDIRALQLDDKHVGLSGLGLLGYILQANGFVQFKLKAVNIFEDIYNMVHRALAVDENQSLSLVLRRMIGREYFMNTSLLTMDAVLVICRRCAVTLSKAHLASLRDDVNWIALEHRRVSTTEFIKLLRSNTFLSNSIMMGFVRTRFGLSNRCRQALGLLTNGRRSGPTTRKSTSTRHSRPRASRKQALYGGGARPSQKNSTRAIRVSQPTRTTVRSASSAAVKARYAPMFVDYGRCLENAQAVSKMDARRAQNLALNLYNMRTTAELSTKFRASLTEQAYQDLANMLGQTNEGNAYASIIQLLLVSTSVTEAVEFKDVRTMHILEPPKDYRQLEQMFGRVIRRGSHPGLRPHDRNVTIKLYVMTAPHLLKHVQNTDANQPPSMTLTADEIYWEKVIKRKYEISQQFYSIMKYMAVDCRDNLVLNSASEQDRNLICYEYPYQANSNEEVLNLEAPVYYPADLLSGSFNSPNTIAVDVLRALKHESK